MTASERTAKIVDVLNELLGFQIFKSWNTFATRMFYFASPGLGDPVDDGDYRLTLECPWRIEQHNRIVVGSEDYGVRADNNSAADWDRTNMQWGHLQDQKLVEILGKEDNGTILNTRSEFVVERVKADALGGFQLSLSGGYTLSVFPASNSAMEWLLSRRSGGNLGLSNGDLCESAN